MNEDAAPSRSCAQPLPPELYEADGPDAVRLRWKKLPVRTRLAIAARRALRALRRLLRRGA